MLNAGSGPPSRSRTSPDNSKKREALRAGIEGLSRARCRKVRGKSPPATSLITVADPHRYRPAPGEIPEDPGVYRFRDERGRVVYVGKAKSLRQRLNQYFADFTAVH